MEWVHLEVVGWLVSAFGPYSGRLKLEEAVSPGTSLDQLLRFLARKYPGFKKAAFQPDGSYNGLMNVVVNDRLLSTPSEQESPLQDGDTIVLVPAYAGG